MNLRLFTASDGHLIARWMADPAYSNFFRHTSIVPTLEDCAGYPNWTQNLVMMAEIDGETIGMVTAYHADNRNRSVKAGCLLDKRYHKRGLGHDVHTLWIQHLFNQCNFRKVVVECTDEYLVEAYKGVGFQEEGRYREECFLNGKWADEIRLGCFRDEFKVKFHN